METKYDVLFLDLNFCHSIFDAFELSALFSIISDMEIRFQYLDQSQQRSINPEEARNRLNQRYFKEKEHLIRVSINKAKKEAAQIASEVRKGQISDVAGKDGIHGRRNFIKEQKQKINDTRIIAEKFLNIQF